MMEQQGYRWTMWEPNGPAYVHRGNLDVELRRGTIVDLETTALRPSHGHIICFGCIFGTTIEIRAKDRKATWKEYYARLRVFVKRLPRPLYAYNAKFDGGFLRRYCDFRERIIDLFEPWRSRAESRKQKFPSLDELVRGPWDALPPYRIPEREVDVLEPGILSDEEEQWLRRHQGTWRGQAWERKGMITGKDVPRLWGEYLNGEDEALVEIAEHNRQDLLKTLCLLAFLGRPLTK
jgi:hypothetical protein